MVLIDDEGTVKRLYIRDDMIELRPDNPKHRPISIGPGGDLRIVGKVVAVRQTFRQFRMTNINEKER